jgi:hypothetical protein
MAICHADDRTDPRNALIAPPVCACCHERVKPGLLESCSVPLCQYEHEDLCPYCRTRCVDCGRVHCMKHVDACEHTAGRKADIAA